eukprot:gene21163-biopygen10157
MDSGRPATWTAAGPPHGQRPARHMDSGRPAAVHSMPALFQSVLGEM